MKELSRQRLLSYLGPVAELGEMSLPEKDSLPGKEKPDGLWIYLWAHLLDLNLEGLQIEK